jgi:hypothetical protein
MKQKAGNVAAEKVVDFIRRLVEANALAILTVKSNRSGYVRIVFFMTNRLKVGFVDRKGEL